MTSRHHDLLLTIGGPQDMADEDAFLAGIPRFLRRLDNARMENTSSKFNELAPGMPERPRSIAALAAKSRPAAPEAEEPAAAGSLRDVAAQQEALRFALREGQLPNTNPNPSPDPGPDAAFQVMLPQDVVRQVRLRAAREGTTNRAVVLNALARDGIAVPAGAATDRRRKRA